MSQEEYSIQEPRKQWQGFARINDADKKAYVELENLINSEKGTYTIGMIREKLRGILATPIHKSMRERIIFIFDDISRDRIDKALEHYENHLLNISPAPLPNESKSEYEIRTNFPSDVVDLVYSRGDNEEF